MKKYGKSPADPFPWLRLAALFAALAASVACAAGSGGGPAWETEGPAFDLALGLYQRGESLSSLAVRGGASLTAGTGRHVFRFEALVMKPDRLLFTAFDPLGRPAFRLAAGEGRLACLSYGDRRYATGPATPENFARFIPLGLSQAQLTALLSGAAPRPAAAGARLVGDHTELIIIPAGGDENSAWRLRLAGGLAQDPRRVALISAARGRLGRPDLSLRYLSVEDTPREDGEKEPFPRSVEAEWRLDGEKRLLHLNYQETRLGLPLTEADFVLNRPDGFEMVELFDGKFWAAEDSLD